MSAPLLSAPATLLVPLLAFSSALAADACQGPLPATLAKRLEQENAAFLLPRASDNLAGDIEAERESGGSGCLGIASGDFDGDGRADYAVALTGRSSKAGRVVVGLRSGNGWTLHPLVDWPEGRERLYVESVGAALYHRFPGIDAPVTERERLDGERETMTCKHRGVMLGATEASGVVYCHSNGAWPHVWVSD